ncbi:MAG: bifunctional DNA-formamidopyrimidine glycosylase/DNA-(apurinic or apyrimidinic site) lyase [Alphaproteobacteria bacterium]|nr:bifunctional DNA-formamidopyrimidine glycosylase/DNA-(apurinic or apyrimidinic site) lyase [Alphaproteobacteria bacterium]
MPELPEVETVRRGLAPTLEGARLVRVEARRPDLRFPLPPQFAARLTGARVLGLTRRGKYILAALSTDETWLIHLGMTGRFEVLRGVNARAPGEFVHVAPQAAAHAHIVVETESGARLTYFDARRFGFMDLAATATLAEHPRLVGMGPEPLGPDFTPKGLQSAFAGRRQNVKALLLDQRVVAGLGNIYVCEALFRARLSPRRAAGGVGLTRLARLTDAIREVLEGAIAAGGSTLRDFADVAGGAGYFQHRFEVYGREGEACTRSACPGVVRRLVQGGRSTFFCPVCQT